MKKRTHSDEDHNLEAFEKLTELGLDKSMSPDQLKDALRQLVNRKVIADFKVKKEKDHRH